MKGATLSTPPNKLTIRLTMPNKGIIANTNLLALKQESEESWCVDLISWTK